MRVTIRRATAADVDALVPLLGELFSIEADFAPDADRQRRGLALLLADPAQRLVLVAERARGAARARPERPPALVGMVTVQLVVSTAEGGLSALVEDMVVAAGERGRGTGRRLLERAGGWARGRGASRLQLLADRENEPALRFYERLGWRGTRLVCLRRGGR
jgi:GNAT superfamily N-acetyltransferase